MLKNQRVTQWAICLLFTLTLKLNAQTIQVSLHPVLSTTFGSKDIWNADVTNQLSTRISVKFRSTVSSSDGTLLFEAVTVPVLLQTPFVSLNSLNLQTSSLTYYNDKVKQSDESSRSFPTGDYIHCMYVIDAVTGETKAQQCVPVNIKVLTPPILIYPANKESIQEKNPLLTWLLPGPLSNPADVRYNLTLVELYADQAANDGLLRNRPLVYEKGLSQTSLQYPYSAPALAYGKQYAWQVEATSVSGVSYGITEIWSFNLVPDSVKEIESSPDQSYVDIKNSGGYQVYYAKGKLKIKHSDRKYPLTLRYSIYTDEGAPVFNKGTLQALSKDNWFEIDLEKEQRLKHKQKYRFELNDGQSIYKIYFYYLDPARTK